jgi:hypothetical protein
VSSRLELFEIRGRGPYNRHASIRKVSDALFVTVPKSSVDNRLFNDDNAGDDSPFQSDCQGKSSDFTIGQSLGQAKE